MMIDHVPLTEVIKRQPTIDPTVHLLASRQEPEHHKDMEVEGTAGTKGVRE